MKIDKEKLRALSELSDDALWATIMRIAEGNGISIPKSQPSKDDMAKIREAMSDPTRLNLSGALRVIKKHKGG